MMIKAKLHWAKIVGKPVGGYPNGKGPEEWSVDAEVDEDVQKQLFDAGMDEKYLKTSKDGTYKYIKFVRKALTFKGDPGKPFKIVDAANNPWNDDRLIGNGSEAFVKMEVQEIESTGAMKPKAFAFKIAKLVPYEGGEEFPDVEGAEDWSGE